MTPEQMRQTLLTSDKTGLPNRRAFDEAQHQPAAAVAMSDADGLKALNDRFGYDAGDALLQAKADALRAAGVEAYHDKGDEFLYRGASPEELKTKLENAREILRNRVIEAEMTDGSVHRFKGADFSYGTGAETTEAERALKDHKSEREASGERARGELRGIARVGPEEGKEDQGGGGSDKAPAAAGLPDRPSIAGHDGRDTDVLTPTRKLPAAYRLVEAADLIPSHDAQSFARNDAYPEGVQERDYERSKEAQNRVIQQAQNYDPAYTVNTNPDAVNGPPVITLDGTVLGGNSRAMSTQRLYADGKGDAYRETLKRDAATYGLKPEQVDGLKEPVLVRQIERPESVEDARRIGSELNKSMTGALGVSEKAVSAGKNLKPETLRAIADMLNEDDSTVRELLARRGPELLRMMTADGVITERERPQFVDSATGGLSEEGKTFFERALLGSAIDDPRLMDAAPKSILNKIERSLGAIASFGSRSDEWNLLPSLREAVAEHAAIAKAGSTVELRLGQRDMFGPARNPVVDTLVRALDEKPTAVHAKFDAFAKDADRNPAGQVSMFGGGEAFDAFNHAFGSKLTDEEYIRGNTQAIRSDPARDRGEEKTAVRDAGVPERADVRGEASGGSESAGRAPRPPIRAEGSAASSRAEVPGRPELAPNTPTSQDRSPGTPPRPPKPSTEKTAFTGGRQSTPIEVRDAEGNWQKGTLDYYNDGVNGTPRRGRVTLDNGFKMNNVADGDMRAGQSKQESEGIRADVGVDFDGTIAKDTGTAKLGEPLPERIASVKKMIDEGKTVEIITRRVANDPTGAKAREIQDYLEEHGLPRLVVTDKKTAGVLYDDNAHHVPSNENTPLVEEPRVGETNDEGNHGERAAGLKLGEGAVPEGGDRRAEGAMGVADTPGHGGRLEGAGIDARTSNDDTAREQGRRQDSSAEEHPDITRERKENEARAKGRKDELGAARERTVYDNAAQHSSEIMEIDGRKALVLDPAGEQLWHRGLDSFPKLKRSIGAGESWRGMTLDANQAKAAVIAFDGLAQQLRADGIANEATIAGVERLADLVQEARGKGGSAAILRSDFRADTAREEAVHQWMMQHEMEDSDAVHGVASRPEFRDALEQIREQGYNRRPFAEQAVELMAHVMAGDPELRMTDAEREELARAFLTESVEEHGPEILRNLPAMDPRLTDVRREVTRGYDYGDEYAQGDAGGGVQERGGEGKRAAPTDAEGRRRGPRKAEAGAPDPGGRERRAGIGGEQGDGQAAEAPGQLKAPRPPKTPEPKEVKKDTTGPDEGPVFQRSPPTDSEEFQTWFGDSKAVDEDKKPQVVYHGTALNFDSFDPRRTGGRTPFDNGDFGQASYFAEKPETSEKYAASSALGQPFEYRGPEVTEAEVRKVAEDREGNAALQMSARDVARWMADDKSFTESMNRAGSPALAERFGGSMEKAGEERRQTIMPVYLKAENPLVLRSPADFQKLYELGGGEDEWFALSPAEQAATIQKAGYDSVHDKSYGQWAVFDPKQVKSSIGNRGTFDPDEPSILFQRAKDEENPVARTVADLVDDLKSMPKGDKGTALDRVSNWTKDTIDESLSRSGKALGGVPSAFEKAFAWAKATTAALVHDYRNPLEQTDWKTQAGQMQLSQAETALRLQDLGKALKEAAPKQLDRIAMTHWMEAAGDKAKLEEWQAGAKARAMQAMNSDIPSDRKRFLRETQAHYDQALKLTPEQQNLARRLREHFDDMLDLAKQNGLLEYGYRNYVMHLYEKADAANLLHLVDNSELNPNPSFLKRRFHDTFYAAEGDGLTPKSKDIGYLLTAYDKSMNEAIASRNFMRSLLDAKAPDGRPIAAIKTRGGWVIAKGDEAPQVLKQRARPESLEGYRDFDRPQLRNFLFKPTLDDLDGFDPKLFDEDPRSLAFKGDLIIHPKYASRVEDMLTPSWFERGEGGAQRIGNAIVKGSALAKELMTAVAPFHMVQEGVHGLEHKVNPFKLPKIDLGDKTQRLLASHGLTLTNYDAEGLFSAKALRGITEFVPGVNKAMDQMQSFSRWQFEDYIPRLKMSMAKDAFERNVKRYPNLSEEQVAELSAKQSNAAFGNLNTTFDAIPRTKTFKTLLRLATFAPDFLESRMRFVGQAFTKYGGEQRTALVRGALVMYAASRIANAVLNQGDAKWDPEHAFSVVVNGRSYSLRTVQGDILHAVTDPRGFIYNRLNPLTTRPVVEFLSGRDQMGRQKSTFSQVKDLGKSALPFGVQKVIQTPDEDWLNSILTSTGLEAKNYRTPTEEAVHKMYLAHIPDAPEDEEKEAEGRKMRQMEDKVRSGHMTAGDVWAKVQKGEITPKEARRTIDRAHKSRLQIEFQSLSLRDAMSVYAKANPLEQAELRPELAHKRELLAELPEADRKPTAEKMNELLAENKPQ